MVAHDRLPTGRMEGVWVEDGKQKIISGGWGANWGFGTVHTGTHQCHRPRMGLKTGVRGGVVRQELEGN